MTTNSAGYACYTEPVRPIEWQSLDAQVRRMQRHAAVLRWICGQSEPDDFDPDPITRSDLEQFGFTIVQKESDGQ